MGEVLVQLNRCDIVTSSLVPLVVDLDGTLVRTDLLYESYFGTIGAGPKHHVDCVRAAVRGRAALKRFLAEAGRVGYADLPYCPAVLELIGAARADGRPVFLATAADRRHAEGVAAHLGLFDGVFASDGEINLSGPAKSARLNAEFALTGFDYVGNSACDLPIWRKARQAYAIRAGGRVEAALARSGVPAEVLGEVHAGAVRGRVRGRLRDWAKAIRMHQYAKNVLLFVPLLTAHVYAAEAVVSALLGFLAFCACASGVYLLNDLVDLSADRAHPRKRFRPFARGAIPISHAVVAIPMLLGVATACALAVSLPFAVVLAGYLVLTTAYSLTLKRKMMVDIVVLAMLYTLRLVAGAVAASLVPSEWLLAFAVFVFLSLALMKRYVELRLMLHTRRAAPSNRGYHVDDLSIVGALAAASAFNAVTIFALYIASPSVERLYTRPALLWLILPVLIYWMSRALMLAHRGVMHDDPLVFALRDRVSHLVGAALVIITLVAI